MEYDSEVTEDVPDAGSDERSTGTSVQAPTGEALTYEIIGVAQKVHRVLGPGFKEVTYHKALERELILRGIPFESKRAFRVIYENTMCGTYEPDLVVNEEVIVELKAASKLAAVDRMQTVSYLKASGLLTALLLNFGAASLEVRRLKN